LTAPIVVMSLKVALAASIAFADGPTAANTRAQCVAAADEAQDLVDRGHLVAARKSLLACAQTSCPIVIRNDCIDWLARVDARAPTVVLKVSDSMGHDVVSTRVTMDGALLTRGVDGKELALDPGPHIFRVEAVGREAIEQRVVVAEWEKGRLVKLIFPSLDPAPNRNSSSTDERPTSASRLPWILGGVGVVAAGASAYFAIAGLRQRDDLRATCGPICPASEKSSVETKYLIADISGGIAAVSLGTALYLLLSRSQANRKASVDVSFIGGGGIVKLDGDF
jgi:hypothetical protein